MVHCAFQCTNNKKTAAMHSYTKVDQMFNVQGIHNSGTLSGRYVVCVYISADTSGCAYTYQEQPLTNLECNPYPNNRLSLSCEVRGPAQVAFSIVWYWEPLNNQQSQRLSASKYGFTLSSSIDTSSQVYRSQLRVQQLNDNDAGWYYCQGNLSNGTLLIPSNRSFLAIESEYTSDIVNASTCPDRAQTTREPSCAGIAIDSSTTASTVSTTPQNPINRGSADPSLSSPTDSNHHPSVLATIITLAPTPTVTSVPDPESDNLQVVLYSMAAIIVVFCATTVTLGISVVILLCRKRCHVKSKKTAGKSILGIFHSSYQATHCLVYHGYICLLWTAQNRTPVFLPWSLHLNNTLVFSLSSLTDQELGANPFTQDATR